MLTYQCRVVLRELKKLTNNTDANFCYLFCTHSFSLDNSEVTYDYGNIVCQPSYNASYAN